MAVSQVSVSKPIVSPNKKEKKSKKNLTQSHSQSDPVQSQQEAPPLLPQPPCDSPSKRTKCPGLRVVGGRIYDPENGKTCHQCRHKTMNFSASCKNRKDGKFCPIRFCHKCLLNRYGEKAEDMAVLDEWKCPKCRGICNCSVCMKRRGHQPTGLFVHTAKATGFSSVLEMLNVKGPENLALEKTRQTASNEDHVATPMRKCGKKNPFNGKNGSNLQPMPSISDGEGDKGQCKSKKVRENDNAGEAHINSASLKKHKAFKNVVATPNEHTTPNKDRVATPIRKCSKENPFDGKNDSNLQPMSSISVGEGDKGQCRSKKVRQDDNAGEGGITSASLKKRKAFKNVVATPNEHITPNKDLVATPIRKCSKENPFDGKNDSNLQPMSSISDGEGDKGQCKSKKVRHNDNAAEGCITSASLKKQKGFKNVVTIPNEHTTLNKDPVATPLRKCGKESPFDGKNDSNLQPMSSISYGEGDKGQCMSKKVRQNDNAGEGGITSASLRKHMALKNVVATPNEHTTPNKDPATPIRKCGKENPFDGKNDSNLQPMSSISVGEGDKGQCRCKKVRQNDNAGEGGITSVSLKKRKAFNNVIATSNEHITPNKDLVATPIRKCGKENPFDGKNDSNWQPMSSTSYGEGDKGQCRSKKVRQNDNAGEGGITSASFKKHKAFRNVVATPNEHTTPKKEQVAFPTRKNFKEKNDSNLQPRPSTLDSEVKKIEESRWKKLRQKDNGGKGSNCGNSLFEKKSSKVSQTFEENPQKIIKTEKKRSQYDDGCPNKVNSELQIPKKISLDPGKKEGKKDKGGSFLPDCDKTEVPYGNVDDATTRPKRVTKSRDARKDTMTTHNSSVDIQLPQGANLTIVAGIDLAAEDVGHALQFLEFCAAFGQVLDLKKGQPESILQELLCRRSGRRIHRTQYSSNVQFHTQLLSMIQKDLGEESHLLGKTSSKDSWLKALGKCISKSHFALKDLLVDCFDRGGDSYDKLDSSQKLRVLNFLCDETLGTVELRNWIDEQNSKFVEREKEAKGKVLAAKNKEKCLKQKLKDDLAKAFQLKRSPLSISEHEDIVSRIKVEEAKAHSETLEAVGMVPKKKQRSDAVRTEPLFLDGDGCAYWKLRCHSSEPILLLQDIGNLDWVRPEEKWYTYDVEQTKVVEKYISSFRIKGIKSVAVSEKFPLGSSEGSLKHESSDILVADTEDEQES